jgi:hypothetical protein
MEAKNGDGRHHCGWHGDLTLGVEHDRKTLLVIDDI